MNTEREMHKIADRIIKAVQSGHLSRVDDLAEALVDLGRKAGKNDLLMDLVDTKQISPEAVEFAIENNGCTDPRK
ncbi:hypothetical protein AB0I81_40025 [Nonomuraea sp. NPDC050404]|uniref:hypothetical protein n=1 Tax=Nonomuraea sp. NPDC050404 TaxID=3155783 RepID=UPI0033C84CB6